MDGQYFRFCDLVNTLHSVGTVVLNRTKNIFYALRDYLQYNTFPENKYYKYYNLYELYENYYLIAIGTWYSSIKLFKFGYFS